MRAYVLVLPLLTGCTLLFDASVLEMRDAAADAGALADGGSDAAGPTDATPADARDGDSGSTTWVDDFNRPDSSVLGNGWIVKSQNAYKIVAQHVENQNITSVYRDNVALRPANEDLLDVAVSYEARLATPPGFPQVLARIQQNTALTAGVLDCYTLYIDNSTTTAILGKQHGSKFPDILATITLAPPIDTTHTFRLRLTVTGTAPVSLRGEVQRFDAQQSKWIDVGAASVMDVAVDRIQTPGAVGFTTSNNDPLHTYDDFTRTAL